MQRYQCHKIVEAERVGNVYSKPDEGGWRSVILENGSPEVVMCKRSDEEFAAGYIVRYADGYVSWSPSKVFEDGYTLIVE